jgi:hypothetical protein
MTSLLLENLCGIKSQIDARGKRRFKNREICPAHVGRRAVSERTSLIEAHLDPRLRRA